MANKPCTVLLVDDDATSLKLGKIRLISAGYRVETATRADEALRSARLRAPDAIVSDVLMDDVDGFGLCRLVREEPTLAAVPVVLLSSHYQGTPDQGLAMRVGAFALVSRTPDFEAELDAVRESLKWRPLPGDRAPDATHHEHHLQINANQIQRLLGKARKAEDRYRALFEAAHELIAILTPDGVILEVNQRSRETLGVAPEELVGRHIREFAPVGLEARNAEQFMESVGAGGAAEDLVALERSDGGIVHMEFSNRVIEVDGRRLVLCIGRDVTSRVLAAASLARAQASLRQAQKMEIIGQLTGAVAHDFNNLLAVILANSHFLMDELDVDDPRRIDAEQIEQAGERAATLVRQLLAFGRRQLLQTSVVDLNAVVGGIEKMLRRLLGKDVEFQVLAEPSLGAVRVDTGQIEQVIMNLLVNARDAMPAGGTLSIATSNLELDEAGAASLSLAPGSYVVLSVTDDGCGMDAETQRHAFENFFTTKEPGKGSGLGLATCEGIVKQSGGVIGMTSEPGRGSVFSVFLPRVDSEVHDSMRREAPAVVDGTETILVVEDDERVRAPPLSIRARSVHVRLRRPHGVSRRRPESRDELHPETLHTGDPREEGPGGARCVACESRRSSP